MSMGCGASVNAAELQESRLQVDDLRKKLGQSEAEKDDLRKQLLDTSTRKAAGADAAGGEAPQSEAHALMPREGAPPPESKPYLSCDEGADQGQEQQVAQPAELPPEAPAAASSSTDSGAQQADRSATQASQPSGAVNAEADAAGGAPGLLPPAADVAGGAPVPPVPPPASSKAPEEQGSKSTVQASSCLPEQAKEVEREEEEEKDSQKTVEQTEAEKPLLAEHILLPGAVETDDLLPGVVETDLLPGVVETEEVEKPPAVEELEKPPAVEEGAKERGTSPSAERCASASSEEPERLSLVSCTSDREAAEAPPTRTLEKQGKDADPKKQSNQDLSEASTCTPKAVVAAVSDVVSCNQCTVEGVEMFEDPSDSLRYCEQCWIDYYGHSPNRSEILPLVSVEVAEIWMEDRLAHVWAEQGLAGWPPVMVHSTPSPASRESEVWNCVSVRVRREIVGPHAREQNSFDSQLYPGEVLASRYRVQHSVGEGHFTKAYMAEDLKSESRVCLKRHRSLSVEALADLMVIARRIEDKDPGGKLFPTLIDSFYDVVGFTVEALLEGRTCLSFTQSEPTFFRSIENLRIVARGTLEGLAALEMAGVVHNDVKPDNLIWTEVPADEEGGAPRIRVKIVDFGCARLDMHEEPVGRNWSLAEGGAGHLGKWSPEMVLRLPITNRADIWGAAISCCELHCGRFVWRNESDTAEIVLAQSVGLCNLTNGLPSSLLRHSPLDVRQLYTPAPRHFPVRQNNLGQLEVLRPSTWGLDQIVGGNWRTGPKAVFGDFLERALVVDPFIRPSAAELLESCPFLNADAGEV